ncbi:MAG: ATP-dependent metallopeptidase FtsH/Yme1/Tma family protein, partial [Candidatus Gastranaerophilaceae bacterium]
MNKSQSTGMYIILGIMVLAFISMLFSGPTTTTEELTYTKFLNKLAQCEIKSVELDKEFLLATPKTP